MKINKLSDASSAVETSLAQQQTDRKLVNSTPPLEHLVQPLRRHGDSLNWITPVQHCLPAAVTSQPTCFFNGRS